MCDRSGTCASEPIANVEVLGNLACPLCSSAPETIFEVPYLDEAFAYLPVEDNPFARLRTKVCGACGFGWAVPDPDRARVRVFYETVYRGLGSVFNSDRFRPYQFAALQPRPVAQILLARMFGTLRPGDAILDIGPGLGSSFAAVSALLPGIRCFAFEPDQRASRFLEEVHDVHVFGQSFTAETSVEVTAGQKFQMVLMSHVLEHYGALDAVPVLRNVRSLLSDGGILVCEVPNCDWRRYRTMRRSDSPHLTFFSEESLRLALLQAGLTPRFVSTCAEEYGTYWERLRPDSPLPPTARGRSRWRKAVGGLARGVAALVPVPTAVTRAAYEMLSSRGRTGSLLGYNDFAYGGDRICLRAAASPAIEPR